METKGRRPEASYSLPYRGEVPTFSSHLGAFIIDVSLINDRLSTRVEGWEVVPGAIQSVQRMIKLVTKGSTTKRLEK